MKLHRQVAPAALVTCLIVVPAFFLAPRSDAQEKPGQKPSPSPEKELLKVQPAPTQTPQENSSRKGQSQTESQAPGQQQKPGTEVDEKGPVIVNTDLITFNVTVTDIYGRFVSGLARNAFTIYD